MEKKKKESLLYPQGKGAFENKPRTKSSYHLFLSFGREQWDSPGRRRRRIKKKIMQKGHTLLGRRAPRATFVESYTDRSRARVSSGHECRVQYKRVYGKECWMVRRWDVVKILEATTPARERERRKNDPPGTYIRVVHSQRETRRIVRIFVSAYVFLRVAMRTLRGCLSVWKCALVDFFFFLFFSRKIWILYLRPSPSIPIL